MSLFSSIQAEKYRGYTFTGVNKPLLASGERSFHARLRTPVDPDGISFSTDLAGPCRLLIRNSIPRITLPAALLRLGIASATNLVTPGRDALVLLSRSNYPLVRRVFIPSAHLSLGSVDHGVNAGNLENFLLLSCFYFFFFYIITLGNSWETKFFFNSNL